MSKLDFRDKETKKLWRIQSSEANVDDDTLLDAADQYLTTGKAPKGYIVTSGTPTITKGDKTYESVIPKKCQPVQPFFPIMDEIVGGVRGAVNPDLSVGEAIKLEKDTYKQAYDEDFLGSLAKESGSGILGLPALKLLNLGKLAPTEKPLTWQNVGSAATYGLAAGDVEVDNNQFLGIDWEETTKNKLGQGAISGVTSPVIQGAGQKLVNIVSNPIKMATNVVTDKIAKSKAKLVIKDALKDGNQKIQDVIETIIKTNDPTFVLADSSKAPQLSEILRAAIVSSTGEARNRATKFLRNRNDGIVDRIDAGIKTIFGDQAGYFKTMQSLTDARKKTGNRLYERSFENGKKIPIDDNFLRLMDNELFDYGLEAAKKVARLDGYDIPNIQLKNGVFIDGKGNSITEVDTKFLHYIKLGMDEYLSKSKKEGSLGNMLFRGYTQRKTDFLDWLDNKNKWYKTARNQWAGDTSVIDALELGKNAVKIDSDELEFLISTFNKSEKESFRNGYITHIYREMDRTISGVEGMGANAAWKLINTPHKRDIMKLAFGDDKKFKKFWSKLTAEVQKKITSNAALSGSKTADRTAVTKIIQDFGDLYKPSNLTKTIKNVFSDPTINDPLNKKMEEKLSNELVNILLTTGRKELAELEKDLLDKGLTNQIRNKWIPILMNLAKTQAVYAPQRANPEFFQDQLGDSLINTTINTTKGLLQQE